MVTERLPSGSRGTDGFRWLRSGYRAVVEVQVVSGWVFGSKSEVILLLFGCYSVVIRLLWGMQRKHNFSKKSLLNEKDYYYFYIKA